MVGQVMTIGPAAVVCLLLSACVMQSAGKRDAASDRAVADPGTAAVNERLWYDKPATSFHQSLPLGDGRIGAMVFGGVDEERIILNESSVWSGSPNDDNRPEAYKALPEIRRLLAEGKNPEAENLVMRHFTCQGAGSGHAVGR